MSGALRVALGQYDTAWHAPETSIARARRLVQDAVAQGAHLVALPEMCTTGFTMETKFAEPMDGPSVHALGEVACEAAVHVLAGLSIREETTAGERAFNTALLFGDDGKVRGVYRKQRLFAFAGEHDSYARGNAPLVCSVRGVKISPFVCYDLRFPELFGKVAPNVDAMIVVANWPASRRSHWLALLQARAIENQCYVIGVNRLGTAGGLTYSGDSIAFDPWGETVAESRDGEEVQVVEVDPARVAEIRGKFPFLRDR